MPPANHMPLLVAEFPQLFASHWPARGLAARIRAVDVEALCDEYRRLRNSAPRRSGTGKRYFVGHTGIPSSSASSNRLEEHTALALMNLGRRWPQTQGGWFRLLDYQLPLKSRQADARIGKVDLLGLSNEGRLIVVELKVPGRSGGRGDPPSAALMEALRYAAMIEADIEAIASEAEARFGAPVRRSAPELLLLAPANYWRGWLDLPGAGDWPVALADVIAEIEASLGRVIACQALEDVGPPVVGLNGTAPRLARIPSLRSVRLGPEALVGDHLPAPASMDPDSQTYLANVQGALWDWADKHHQGQLDGGGRQGRSPVLGRDFAAMNILASDDDPEAAEVRAAIPKSQRHRHFASLRSSQALAQSVFGALAAYKRLDLLESFTAECGRPAFFDRHAGWTLKLEHEVSTLGEPRPTSLDVLFQGPTHKVAVECKFTESEFGACSRPGLRPSDSTYAQQHCDGAYHIQAGRHSRCALTEIGIPYWKHLPTLFDWPADQDHVDCPFRSTYQLARNALGATVTSEGQVAAQSGHVLVVYDANNPAYQAGGGGELQWEAATAACLVPGLLRRISWQRLLGRMAVALELKSTAVALQEKYALSPREA